MENKSRVSFDSWKLMGSKVNRDTPPAVTGKMIISLYRDPDLARSWLRWAEWIFLQLTFHEFLQQPYQQQNMKLLKKKNEHEAIREEKNTFYCVFLYYSGTGMNRTLLSPMSHNACIRVMRNGLCPRLQPALPPSWFFREEAKALA